MSSTNVGLASRIVVRTSAIHGKGVFARRRLRRGAYIGTFEGSPTTRDGTYVLWVRRADGSIEGVRGRNALRFLNHASDPNAEFVGDELVAIRNIQPGAEITLHYGDDWDDLDDA